MNTKITKSKAYEYAQANGWTVTQGKRGKLRYEKLGRVVYAALTPSDWRGDKNNLARLRRTDKELGCVQPQPPTRKEREPMTTVVEISTPEAFQLLDWMEIPAKRRYDLLVRLRAKGEVLQTRKGGTGGNPPAMWDGDSVVRAADRLRRGEITLPGLADAAASVPPTAVSPPAKASKPKPKPRLHVPDDAEFPLSKLIALGTHENRSTTPTYLGYWVLFTKVFNQHDGFTHDDMKGIAKGGGHVMRAMQDAGLLLSKQTGTTPRTRYWPDTPAGREGHREFEPKPKRPKTVRVSADEYEALLERLARLEARDAQ